PLYTFDELIEASGIGEEDVGKTVQSLSMGKPTQRILVRQPAVFWPRSPGQALPHHLPTLPRVPSVNRRDQFFVNDAFTSKLFRIKIASIVDPKANSTAARPGKSVEPELPDQLTDDRKHEVECAVVRVMKARKTLDHSSLVMQVAEQVAKRFIPTPALIKQRIEALIERDYLVRDNKDPRIYSYVS
ncbi:unnamed protein product, partial [Mesorhabditis spiculigera]